MRYDLKVLSFVDLDLSAAGDSYHFGIYSGSWMDRFVATARGVRKLPRRIWGFDTFCGFPSTPNDQLGKYRNGGFFDVRKKLKVDTAEDAMRAIEDAIDEPRVSLLRGAFTDVLTPELVDVLGMRPACLVDVDCDLYRGAHDAPTWMRSCGLLVPGTVICYDDWDAFPVHEGGESLAHDETVADICEEVWISKPNGHQKAVFRVK